MTYSQVITSIRNALTQRPEGTLVDDAAHEAAEINILDFAKAIADGITAMNSPFCGSIYPELAQAIKPISFKDIEPGALYYINEVVAGHLQENGKYLYKVTIMNALSPTSTSQDDTPWMEYIYESTVLYTGLKRHVMTESDGSGGFGTIVIDWSKLAAGEQYICDSYLQGCLFGISLLSYWATLSESDIAITPMWLATIDSSCVINGKEKIYIIEATDDIVITLDEVSKMAGPFKLKNNTPDTFTVEIHQTGDVSIDGHAYIGMIAGSYLEIVPNFNRFEVFGTYTVIDS